MQKKKFYQSSNFWHSLITLIASIFVTVNLGDLTATAHQIIDAAITEKIQWAALIQGAYTFMNMIYQMFIKPGTRNMLQ